MSSDQPPPEPQETADYSAWARSLSDAYTKLTGLQPLPRPDQDLILEAFTDRLEEVAPMRMVAFYEKRPWIVPRILPRAQRDVLWRQPVVLAVYMWVEYSPHRTKGMWPLTPKELSPFYHDLGHAFDPC